MERKCENCYHHDEYCDEDGTFDGCTCDMTKFMQDPKEIKELGMYHELGCPDGEDKVRKCPWFRPKE